MASLTFYGATNSVTGSAYLIQTEHSTVLLECGLLRGSKKEEMRNAEPFEFDIDSVDAVVLSHAHLDHSGRLPKLVTDGYGGPIYMTQPTYALLEILLKDSASLAQRDVEWKNKRLRRAGKDEIAPLYTLEDVDATTLLCEGLAYGRRDTIADGIEICYRDAGHILGSAIVELFITEGGKERKLVFSGDLGNSEAALLDDAEIIEQADVLIMESTYGDRNHRPMQETLDEFESIVEDASENGGNILIPSFAVGRTQEIIFRLGQLYQKGKLRHQAVYLDSPMAIAATEVYHRYQNVFNQDDRALLREGKTSSLHAFLPVLRYSQSTEESMKLNRIQQGAIIIAGSGMCNGGRIRHHLKQNLWRKKSHVMIVGFQAMGTPGRALVDGAEILKLAGEEIIVKATIHTLGGFSAHAGQTQLLEWAGKFKTPRPKLYLVHGEENAKLALKDCFAKEGWEANIAQHGENIPI